MNWKEINYKKDGTICAFAFPFCVCGSAMRQVGWSACVVDDRERCFFQCEKCMRLDIDSDYMRHTHEGLTKLGWIKN